MNATPHQDIRAAVDRLLAGQEVKAVKLAPASGVCRAGENVVISKAAWDAIRWLASGQDVRVPENNATLGQEAASRFRAALQKGEGEAERWPAEHRSALKKVISVIGQGRGLLVSGVQEESTSRTVSQPAPARKATPAGGAAVSLSPAREYVTDQRVNLDDRTWRAVCELGRKNGHGLTDERVLGQVDASLFAEAIRRGAVDLTDAALATKLDEILSLLDAGGGLIITRRQSWRTR